MDPSVVELIFEFAGRSQVSVWRLISTQAKDEAETWMAKRSLIPCLSLKDFVQNCEVLEWAWRNGARDLDTAPGARNIVKKFGGPGVNRYFKIHIVPSESRKAREEWRKYLEPPAAQPALLYPCVSDDMEF